MRHSGAVVAAVAGMVMGRASFKSELRVEVERNGDDKKGYQQGKSVCACCVSSLRKKKKKLERK